MKLVLEKDVATFRGEKIPYTHFAYKCEDTGEQFTTTELDEINENQVYNAYRTAHGYPFPEEIKKIREFYGVSASVMSEIMGFGANQWRSYEDEKVPNESNSRAICAIRNKTVFMDFLDCARPMIGDKAYEKIRNRVSQLPEYVRSEQPTEMNGYTALSTTIIGETVKYFISELGNTFVTKMNKLLFYTDFLKYKATGKGMSGIQYRAITHGPVPYKYGVIYSRLNDVDMEEFIYPNGTSGILLCSDMKPDMSVFSETEKEILAAVVKKYGWMNAGQISEESHKEQGWIDCESQKSIIPYSYAFALK